MVVAQHVLGDGPGDILNRGYGGISEWAASVFSRYSPELVMSSERALASNGPRVHSSTEDQICECMLGLRKVIGVMGGRDSRGGM